MKSRDVIPTGSLELAQHGSTSVTPQINHSTVQCDTALAKN